MKRAFTLIELLIVVSIIMILTTMALPNFQEAQTRAKVAAVKSNMRVTAINIEMFAVDHNRYPKAITWGLPCKIVFSSDDITSSLETQQYDLFLPYRIGTGGLPFGELAYFNHGLMLDLIAQGVEWDRMCPCTWQMAQEAAGAWSLHSVGPDRVLQGPEWFGAPPDAEEPPPCACVSDPHDYLENALFRAYDPTNGVVSEGNIFRSQGNAGGLNFRKEFYDLEEDESGTASGQGAS